MKYVSLLVTTCLVFFLFPKFTYASLVTINEFVPNGATEWVEFFNSSPSAEYLKTYFLDDDTDFLSDSGSSAKKSLTALNISDPTHPFFETTSLLNNAGDFVVLFTSDGTLVDQYQYTSDPGVDISIGRVPDGSGPFSIFTTSSKGTPNQELVTTPTATQTPTTPSITITNTPSPTVAKAKYKINSIKDVNGAVINNVKIYVDDSYTHHYAAETLIFCPTCFCDDSNSIECGLGTHAIRLVKDGYTDWNEQKTFNPGDNFEVSPILSKAPSEPTQTPTSTPTSVSTPTATNTPALLPEVATESSDTLILSSTDQESGFIGPMPTQEVLGTSSSSVKEGTTPNYSMIVGGTIVAISGPWLYFRRRKD